MNTKFDLLQLLRGLAAILIILHHVSASSVFYFKSEWLWDIFNAFRSNDVFFVLSGFIITYRHLDDLKEKTNTRSFLFKRFNRIYPVFWLVSLIYLGFFMTEKTYVLTNQGPGYIINSFLLIATKVPPLVRVSWSLCYEVIFYLVFGICIFLGVRFAKLVWVSWAIIAIVCSLLFPLNSTFYPFRGFMLEILLGCFIGYVFRSALLTGMPESKLKRFGKSMWVTAIFVYFMIWGISYFITHDKPFTAAFGILYSLAAALIIAGTAMAELKRQVRVPKLFLLLGDASYVIYLTHYLVLALIYKIATHYPQTHNSPLSIFTLGIIAAISSVVFGVLFHKMIEKPFLKMTNRSASNRELPLELSQKY